MIKSSIFTFRCLSSTVDLTNTRLNLRSQESNGRHEKHSAPDQEPSASAVFDGPRWVRSVLLPADGRWASGCFWVWTRAFTRDYSNVRGRKWLTARNRNTHAACLYKVKRSHTHMMDVWHASEIRHPVKNLMSSFKESSWSKPDLSFFIRCSEVNGCRQNKNISWSWNKHSKVFLTQIHWVHNNSGLNQERNLHSSKLMWRHPFIHAVPTKICTKNNCH